MTAPAVRVARCRCGQLTATCVGEPVRVSVCHCRMGQRRTGGPFSAQARWPEQAVEVVGQYRVWEKTADSGRKAWFRWCPDCGGTVAYTNEGMEGVIAIPIGAFALDDTPIVLPEPAFSVWEERKQPWVEIVGEGIERHA